VTRSSPPNDRSLIRAWYGDYLRHCNAHRFDELDRFVASDVSVNGAQVGLAEYIAGLRAVVDAFADYHWQLHHLLIDGDWLAVHLLDTGTHTGTHAGVASTGRRVHTHEFALYRLNAGHIVEVWVTADDLDVVRQLQATPADCPAD